MTVVIVVFYVVHVDSTLKFNAIFEILLSLCLCYQYRTSLNLFNVIAKT